MDIWVHKLLPLSLTVFLGDACNYSQGRQNMELADCVCCQVVSPNNHVSVDTTWSVIAPGGGGVLATCLYSLAEAHTSKISLPTQILPFHFSLYSHYHLLPWSWSPAHPSQVVHSGSSFSQYPETPLCSTFPDTQGTKPKSIISRPLPHVRRVIITYLIFWWDTYV